MELRDLPGRIPDVTAQTPKGLRVIHKWVLTKDGTGSIEQRHAPELSCEHCATNPPPKRASTPAASG